MSSPTLTPSTTSPTHVLCANPGCATGQSALSTCAHCRLACYCSRECQKTHYPEHKLRCVGSNEVTIEQAKKDIAAGPLSWLRAIHIFHLLQTRDPPPSTDQLINITREEHHLRTKLKNQSFDFAELHKKPREMFSSNGDMRSTWHLTFQQGLQWLPNSSRPELIDTKKFTIDNPLVVYWIGARDGNEGKTNFNALSKVLPCPALLYLIGPSPTSTAEGLTAASEQKFGQLKVRRHVGLYNSGAAKVLPPPQYVAMFNAGLDHLFHSWVQAIDPLLLQSPPPVVFVTGYSMDQSFFSSEAIVHALGGRILFAPRKSLHGFTLMYPYTSNHHILAFQGTRDGANVAVEESARKQQITNIHRSLRARGFDVGDH